MILTALPNIALINTKTAQNIGTSVSINYGNLASPANGLIVTATWSAGVFGGAGTFTDTGGNLYLGTGIGIGADGITISATAHPVVNPGTITLNGTSSQLLSLCVTEWSGLGAMVSADIDPGFTIPQLENADRWNSGNSTTASVGPISNSRFGNLLYIATVFIEATGLTITDGSGWTNICSLTNESLGFTNDTQYKIVSGGTSLTPTWTFGSAAQLWICGVQPFLSAPMPPPLAIPGITLQAVNRASTY